MRSIFPRYDPTLSLGQQRYYPSAEINSTVVATSSRVDDGGTYSPSLYTQPEAPSVGRETALSSGLGLQNAGRLSEKLEGLPGFSTPVELVDFWALANGQTREKAAKEYRLELSWYVFISCRCLFYTGVFQVGYRRPHFFPRNRFLPEKAKM